MCREFAIAESTWARWLSQYDGMKANNAKRLKDLESENAQLKKPLAEAELDKAMLKYLAEENGDHACTPEPSPSSRRPA